ncbi:polysaccharide deacetylase family protein [Weissella viridescens]|uniref:Xylanase chitin deacetylase n=1 Tax=Weissella viridescens TaxID=1629 RepID=A0A0R2HC06_WEIVI|nr:polysaccharide deacetylase family protein [Weissella viridescens]KRN46964.1 xylanase chitin deacetylase [Weissella viridescens]MBX4172318.1 polysaccharide deacetylase family protein [Weissella viridescens]GEA94308.1 intercellular adhesion protein [Weissella viridescens]
MRIKRSIYIIFLIIFGLALGNEYLQFSKGHAHSTLPAYSGMFHQESNGVTVLTYHRILKDSGLNRAAKHVSSNDQLHEYNVTETEFKKQMDFLAKKHVKVISYEEMLNMKANGPIHGKYVVLTFDDVDRSMPENAANILEQKQFPYTFFVVTGFVDKKVDGIRMANWKQLEKMAKSPLATVGLHTDKLHYQIDEQPALQSSKISHQTMAADYRHSQAVIKQHTGQYAKYFTYPYGAANDYLTQYMSKHGILSVSTLDPGIVNQGTNNLDVPRMLVNEKSWQNLAKWLS